MNVRVNVSDWGHPIIPLSTTKTIEPYSGKTGSRITDLIFPKMVVGKEKKY
jgi:hypothetical protein